MSQLEEFIYNLPEQSSTQIGEKGSKLSGGQIQRIGIARALYNEPEILILDEPTSSLDEEIEREFLNVLSKIKNKLTIIIISHRPNALKICNNVYRLLNGKINKINLN